MPPAAHGASPFCRRTALFDHSSTSPRVAGQRKDRHLVRSAAALRSVRGDTSCNASAIGYTRSMTKADVQRLLDLPVEERFELAQVLWKSVEPREEARFVLLPQWQRELLDARLADAEANPNDEQTWEEVKAELWPNS